MAEFFVAVQMLLESLRPATLFLKCFQGDSVFDLSSRSGNLGLIGGLTE